MKQKTLLSLLLLLTPAFFLPLHAASEKVGNLYYEVDATNKTATVVKHNSYNNLTGNLVIPSKITHNSEEYTVTTVGESAFSDCSNLNGTLSLPSTIKRIEDSAFSRCNLTGNLEIPETCEYIGISAFSSTVFTGDIVIPSKVTYLGSSAFRYAKNFDGSIIFKNSPETIENEVFCGCNGISGTISIPSSVRTIKRQAFEGCASFEENSAKLTISNGVTSIEEKAFYGCYAITGEIEIPASVTNIGLQAFNCMRKVTKLNVASTNSNYCSVNGILFDKKKTKLIACPAGYNYVDKTVQGIPSTVVTIGTYAFENCQKFSANLLLPDQVITIEDRAFYSCSGLTGDLNLNNVTSIGEYAFYGCSSFDGKLTLNKDLTLINQFTFCMCRNLSGSLNIPDKVTEIGRSAFASCSNLSGSLIIPESVRNLGQSAFGSCSGFKGTLQLSSKLSSIQNSVFDGCSGFTGSLTLPKSLSSIGDKAFSECSGFSGVVTLPDKNMSIGDYAFDKCSKITEFKITNESKPTIGKYSVWPSTANIITPANQASSYKTDSNWKSYSSRIYEIGDANKDKNLNVSDAVTVANYIIDNKVYSFYFICADFNSDDRISISDATGIIEAFVYNTSSTTTADAPRRVLGGKALRIDNFSTSGDVANVGVSISGVEDMVAMQADFYPTDGVIIEGAAIAPELAATHSLTTARLANGALRVVVFSAANAPIAADAPILTLEVSGDEGSIEANNIYAAAADGSDTKLGFYGGVATSGVSGVNVSAVSLETTGTSLTICNAGGADVAICNLAGQNVLTTTLKSDRETIELQNGIYIVRIADKSHKIIIR